MIPGFVASFVLGAAILMGCSDGTMNAPAFPPPPESELAQRKMSEPWSAMGLPANGALVLKSTPSTLVLHFAGIPGKESPVVHRSMVAALTRDGWTKPKGASPDETLDTALERRRQHVRITTRLHAARPQVRFTLQ